MAAQSELKKRLDVVRYMRNVCFSKVKILLTLLLQEDDRICSYAVEEEELLTKINSGGDENK